ncbi:MAG: leucine-rich repeat domain-containing protein [Bacteroidales bacterium]|nr:leucine-rich repeat domain-containing protein [Bacteroidales bacterium]
MIVEQNTNYAYKLKYMENPTFDKVRDLAIKFMRELPKQQQDELYEALNRGIEILDSEPQMVTYLYAFGPMHQAKLNYAFKHLPKEFLAQPEINIIDYGCGQALGTMCYADFLRENGYEQKIKTMTLIEPSEMCLKRAALHASVFFPNAEIKTTNKSFDESEEDDIVCREEVPTLHILSNVLDMLSFDLDKFAKLINGCMKGYNQFICVGPYFNYSVKDNRMKEFCSLTKGKESCYITFDRNEFDKEKEWTAQILCFSKGKGRKIITQEDLELIGEYDVDTYMRMFNTTTLDFVKNPKNPSSLFFSCGLLPNGNRNYGAIGKKALEKIKTVGITNANKGDFIISVYKTIGQDNKLVTFPILQLKYGANVVARFSNAESLEEILSTEVTEEDLANGVEDEFGVIYSKDGKRLLKCKNFLLDTCIIKDGTMVICDKAFHDFWNRGVVLRQIVIPNSVKIIGNYAFSYCESLKQIVIPNSVTIIGESAFASCGIRKLTIPQSVTRIGDNPFWGCTVDLKNDSKLFVIKNQMLIERKENRLIAYFGHEASLSIPDSVKCIGGKAFKNCKTLRKIIIPNSVDTIGDRAFEMCRSLQQITIPQSVVSIGRWAYSCCESLKTVFITNSVTFIGNGAFHGCSSLRQVIIPDNVTTIGDEVFEGCESLEQVYIPESVNSIGMGAFAGCNSLKQINIPKTVISVGEEVFDDCSSLQKITIPRASTEKFKKMLDEELWDKLIEE